MVNKGFILCIDDDQAVSTLLDELLTGKGYKVKTVSSAFQARGALAKQIPNLIILDRGLPDTEGLDFIKEIRSRPGYETLPVLFLTARGTTHDKVQGLQSGADDYLTKPFANAELLARVDVLLRRSKLPPEKARVIEVKGLRIDLTRHEIEVNKRNVDLAPKEYELLVALTEQPGHVLSRRFLLERVWGAGMELQMNTKTVDVAVGRLRTALGPWGKNIVAVQAYGYQLDVNEAR